MFMLRNIYPKFVNDSIISRLKEKKTSLPPVNDIDSTKFWMGLLYQGVKRLRTSSRQKIKSLFQNHCQIHSIIQTHCSSNDKIPIFLKSNVVYALNCPAWNSKYVNKTNRPLIDLHLVFTKSWKFLKTDAFWLKQKLSSAGPVTKLKNLSDVHSILLGAVENDFQLFIQKESYEIASHL